jgi:uncharacterized repeat protein (TIGR01451 family)
VSFTEADGVTPSSVPVTGGKAVYTVTAENTGGVPYTATTRLVLRDDLSELLQGATLDPSGGFTASWNPNDPADSGAFQVSGTQLVWRGTLAANQTVTLTYSATLDAGGRATVKNTVWEPSNPYTPNPPTPECDPVTRATGSGEACATASFGRPLLLVSKSSAGYGPDGEPLAQDEPLATGDTLTYTVRFRNVGTEDFGPDNLAMILDSLAGLAGGAEYEADSAKACIMDAANDCQPVGAQYAPTYANQLLTWRGVLEAGAEGRLTYNVTLLGGGPASLPNAAWTPDRPDEETPPADCAPPGNLTEFQECSASETPRALMHLDKTVQGPDSPRVGDRLTYTVRLTNLGDAPYQGDDAVLFDDLASVLANARLDGGITAVDAADMTTALGEAKLSADGTRIEWRGPLAAGQGVAMVFSIILEGASGSDPIYNIAWAPADPGDEDPPVYDDCPPSDEVPDPNATGRCAATETPRTDVAIQKHIVPDPSVPGASVPVPPATGDEIFYQVTMENTGGIPFTAQNPALLVDDLTDVLQTSVYLRNATAAYSDSAAMGEQPVYGANRLVWTGPLDVKQKVTITYSVRLRAAATAEVRNVAWSPADPFSPTTPPQPECATDEAGEQLIGPAGGVDAKNGEPCASANLSRALLNIEKSVSLADEATSTAWPGDTLTYQLEVTNISKDAGFTAENASVVWDDMADVLREEGTYLPETLHATTGTASDWTSDATVPEYRVKWTGALGPGQKVVITYDVYVTAAGDGWFRNVVWVPFDRGDKSPSVPSCAGSSDGSPVISVATGEICAGLNVTTPMLTLSKSSRPQSAQLPGQTVTYTIEAANVGAAPYPADRPMVVQDDLTQVLDDAVLVGDPSSTLPGQFARAGDMLTWSGAVPPGAMVRIAYQVRIGAGGDGILKNTAWGPLDPENPGDTPLCETGPIDGPTGQVCASEERLAPKLKLTKELVSPPPYTQGARSEFRVTVKNTGAAPFTAALPAVVVDDLSDVLDGGALDGYSVDPDVGTLQYRDQLLRWTGPLDPEESVTLSYFVVWSASGNGDLRNVVFQPLEPDNPAPLCEDTVDGIDQKTGEVCALVAADRPLLEIVKESDGHDRQLTAGDKVTYTITARNITDTPYTSAARATLVDSLAGVLNGAVFNGDQKAQTAGMNVGEFHYDADLGLLRWDGPLAGGAEVKITFSVTLTSGGNGVSRNVAWSPADPAVPWPPAPTCAGDTKTDPATGEPCDVDRLVRPSLVISKWSDADHPQPGGSLAAGSSGRQATLRTRESPPPCSVTSIRKLTAAPLASGPVQVSWPDSGSHWRSPAPAGVTVTAAKPAKSASSKTSRMSSTMTARF